MKKISIIMMFVATILSCTCMACNNEPNPNDTIIPGKIVSIDTTSGIEFDFGLIDTVVFVDDGEVPVLHYDDPDAFDYDYLADVTNREHWYGNYIAVDIEEEIQHHFFEDYKEYKSTNDYWAHQAINELYMLEEHKIVYADGTVDVIFYVVFNDEIYD